MQEDSVFHWGARQTGRSTLLKKLFPGHRYYDLLKGDVFERFNRRSELLREELLLLRRILLPGSPEYGKAFEHFIIQELQAWKQYTNSQHEITYWRTASGFEVDIILGDAIAAIEIKSAREIHSHHLKGLKAFAEEHPKARLIIVAKEENRRISGKIEIIPYHEFLQQLWNGNIFRG